MKARPDSLFITPALALATTVVFAITALGLSAWHSVTADVVCIFAASTVGILSLRRALGCAPFHRPQRSKSFRSRLSQRQTGPFPVR